MDNNLCDNKRNIDYHLYLSNKDINIGITILIGSITAFLTIMFKSITNDTSNNSPIFILYFNIVIVLISIYSMKAYGILVAGISAGLFCLTLDKFIITEVVVKNMSWNIFVNIVQAIIIWFVLFKLRKLKIIENVCFVQKDEKRMSDRFKILLSITGIIYVIVGIGMLVNQEVKSLNGFIFAFIIVIVLLYFIEGISNRIMKRFKKSIFDFKYLFFICTIPGCIAAFINSSYPIFFESSWVQNYVLWAGSNFILLSTFGYVIFCFFSDKKNDKNDSEYIQQKVNDLYPVKAPLLLYYIAIILWNILFFTMYAIGWLDGDNKYTITYIFPWLIGNLLFISNFVLSRYDEFDVNNSKEANIRFKWFEDRAVVAEKNTAIVMQIVALAIPFIMTLSNNKPSINIIIIFVLNISVAISSIALIWVHQSNIKFMSLLKTLKTILHLFSISLLLLNSIMFINDF